MNIPDFLNKKISAGRLNTPIQYMPRLSKRYDVDFYMKRDDMTGAGLSGNKIRKLEYLFYDAEAQGADTVITCGGTQSNHARATAVLARIRGLHPILLLYGKQPQKPYDGNLLLDYLLDAELHWALPDDIWNNAIMEEIAEKERANGKKPYIIPMGGSNTIGSLGYVNCALEIMKQQDELGLKFDYVFCSVGSGGTLAGLIIGKSVFGWNTKILGVNVSLDKDFFISHVSQILEETEKFNRKYGVDTKISSKDINIIDGFVGAGYAIPSEEEMELIKLAARAEGIFLDPVYTGKTFWALDTLLKNHKIERNAKILFIHTGGIYGLFPERKFFFN